MTGSFWLDLLIGLACALLFVWPALVIVLLIVRPRGDLLREALRLLPDVLRLVGRLAADRTLPRGVRIRLGLLLACLALPIDLIPDVVPVLGHADDAIVVAAVLRGVVRRSGIEAVRAHWPGTDDGFDALVRLTGLDRRVRCPPPPHRGGRPRRCEGSSRLFPTGVAGGGSVLRAGVAFCAVRNQNISLRSGLRGHGGRRSSLGSCTLLRSAVGYRRKQRSRSSPLPLLFRTDIGLLRGCAAPIGHISVGFMNRRTKDAVSSADPTLGF